ncbi:MAG TPA: hypothetical protein VG204_11810 [Terriglobia bacterium]|nr:hypothetical protein [Terriglobia bacterium]
MPRVEYWKCGGCGKLKGEDNHWFAVIEHADGFFVAPLAAIAKPTEAYCGEQCLHKALSQLITQLASAQLVAAR